jgi:glycogen operon protein
MERETFEWARRMIAFRAANPVLTRRNFFQGGDVRVAGNPDLIWLSGTGAPMDGGDWHDDSRRALAMLLPGNTSGQTDSSGLPVVGNSLVAVFNADPEPTEFRLPRITAPWRWTLAFDTAAPAEPDGRKTFASGKSYTIAGRSVAVFWAPGEALTTR